MMLRWVNFYKKIFIEIQEVMEVKDRIQLTNWMSASGKFLRSQITFIKPIFFVLGVRGQESVFIIFKFLIFTTFIN